MEVKLHSNSLDFGVCCCRLATCDSFRVSWSRTTQKGPVEMKHFLCEQKGRQNGQSLSRVEDDEEIPGP